MFVILETLVVNALSPNVSDHVQAHMHKGAHLSVNVCAAAKLTHSPVPYSHPKEGCLQNCLLNYECHVTSYDLKFSYVYAKHQDLSHLHTKCSAKCKA